MADSGVNATFSHQLFLLHGFPGVSDYRSTLVLPFLSIYMMTVMSNGVMAYTILVEKTLHSPMYVLLCLLFLTNLSYTSTVLPRFILGLLFDVNHISLTGCLVQMFFMYVAGNYESHLLVLMGLDRYVAIIMPLRYHHIVTRRTVAQLLLAGCLRSLFLVSLVVSFTSTVQFCRSNIIMNFACENMSLLNLGCGDVSKTHAVGLWLRVLITATDGTCVLASYLSILVSVMKTVGVGGCKKAWSTCSWHLVVTMLTFSCGVSSSLVYRMATHVPLDVQNLISLINFAIPSSADPVIYGLRMAEIRRCLQKTYMKRRPGSWV